MILSNRVFWSDNLVLKDISTEVNDFISGNFTIPITAAQDYLYFGSEAAFNNRWVEISTVNAMASTIQSVEIWDGKDWQAVAEIFDQTKVSGVTMAKSGIIAWVPDKTKPEWLYDDTSGFGNEVISGLASLKIYGLFWARLKFSADLTPGFTVSFIGHKFASDGDLYSKYPEFDSPEARERFKDGTTTFDKIHFEAAEEVIRELKSSGVIMSANQILEWTVFRSASVHKAAELIYHAYGNDWVKEKVAARDAFKEAMQIKIHKIDRDSNATLTSAESGIISGRFYR